ncbi:MAG: AbrB/MazE/SpoVT family DNA-binding domain-containing protein [Thiobacillaceae bacterium]|nr:AbrB/MazE/SpoVT family DNA-binding domain-containing protein [Thiobacillaceae bacterium]
MVKLGTKGQVSVPRSILKKLELAGDTALLVDTTGDGAIVRRPAAIHPVEIYRDERVEDLLPTLSMTPASARNATLAHRRFGRRISSQSIRILSP